ncbi:NADP-dependent oxidoreductase [Flavobacterium sp. MAH-1]|uniref:NADP-dependent oxidoreductase n=2 Tax=Flavobacterium agri TaxID=2743471 RepID=A0A7Y8XZL9_9FLAO|nr:NADP-dependent oxidoreductase [Flavobacterium agri]NYA69651.1 NADP-dependent oxidoreductase [Flavobacterium agri]
MKAMILEEQGGVENFSVASVKIPAISADEVLVKVKALSINPADVILRVNKNVSWVFGGEKPMILGWDISGVVVGVGRNVERFAIGDAVFGAVRHPGHGKAYAEYVAAPADHLAHKPENLSHSEAAASTLAALTALQPVQKVGIKEGSRVFITAAGGGVGHFAIQIAKYYGAHVVALASESKREFVLGLGADEFINYEKERFEDKVSGMDLAIDSVRTPGHVLRSLAVLRKGGVLISLWSGISAQEEKAAKQLGVTAFYNAVQSSGKDMEFLAGLLESRTVVPYISKTYGFLEIPQAHLEIETGQTKGKIIVEM